MSKLTITMMSFQSVLSYLSDVQQDVHKVLEGGGYVFASQAGDVLAHIATKYLVERSSFFAGVV